MAKKRQRVKQPARAGAAADPIDGGSARNSANPTSGQQWCRRLAAALMGGMVVYVAYHPSDSVSVEQGDALWFCVIGLIFWVAAFCGWPSETSPSETSLSGTSLSGTRRRSKTAAKVEALPESVSDGSEGPGEHLGELGPSYDSRSAKLGSAVDLLVWTLAAWMMVAALASSPPGNLRQATNEAWFWIAAAAVLSGSRRLLSDLATRKELLTLVASVAIGLALHALYQEWIDLPLLREQYLADPDAILKSAGIDAPRGSARRMVFANRLLDGGPTATYALANSLAGFLIVGVLLPLGLFRLRCGASPMKASWRDAGALSLLAFSFVSIAAVFATRSRSALVACFLAGLWILLSPQLGRRNASSGSSSRSVQWGVILSAAVVVGVVALLGVMLLGDEEWMAAAPASLEFRLHYWRSTLALLADHPWVGAGPGGFQSMYLQYRLPVANETIADPHNFLFETLASGGLVAGSLLVLCLTAIVGAVGVKPKPSEIEAAEAKSLDPMSGDATPGPESSFSEEPLHCDNASARDNVGLWLGAVVGLGLVWLFALATRRLPDLGASLIAVPGAIAACLILRRGTTLTSAAAGALAKIAVSAILLHLCVSGGWTVPGVALVVWLLVGVMIPGSEGEKDSANSGASRMSGRSLAVLVVGGILLLCLRTESIVPVQRSEILLAAAEDSARSGSQSAADRASLEAIEVDPWAFEPARWRSEFLTVNLIRAGELGDLRDLWRDSRGILLDRSGNNPLVQRAAAEQALWIYQRWGRSEDLQTAAELLDRAIRGNPTDVSLIAQAAVVLNARGESRQAEALAERAREYAELGGNVVRKLELQMIYRAEPLGAAVLNRPALASAERLLDGIDRPIEPDARAVRSNRTEK